MPKKVLIIIDRTYTHIHDAFPYKWEVWMEGVGFLVRGTATTKEEAHKDANAAWRCIQNLPVGVHDNTV